MTMNTRWERRDRKLAKRKRFKNDNRHSVRLLYDIMIQKSQEVKDDRTRCEGTLNENISKDGREQRNEET